MNDVVIIIIIIIIICLFLILLFKSNSKIFQKNTKTTGSHLFELQSSYIYKLVDDEYPNLRMKFKNNEIFNLESFVIENYTDLYKSSVQYLLHRYSKNTFDEATRSRFVYSIKYDNINRRLVAQIEIIDFKGVLNYLNDNECLIGIFDLDENECDEIIIVDDNGISNSINVNSINNIKNVLNNDKFKIVLTDVIDHQNNDNIYYSIMLNVNLF